MVLNFDLFCLAYAFQVRVCVLDILGKKYKKLIAKWIAVQGQGNGACTVRENFNWNPLT